MAEVELDDEDCMNVCGDVHGQFRDLENIFFLKVEYNYIVLGNTLVHFLKDFGLFLVTLHAKI